MAHIKLPNFEEMTPAIQDSLRPIKEQFGGLAEIYNLLAYNERLYLATDGIIQRFLVPDTELSRDTKEMIALLISNENGCKMCVDAHKVIAKVLGFSDERIESILSGVDNINTDENIKKLLKFCIKASKKDNYKIQKDDFDELKSIGFTDSQLVEAVSLVAYFNYANTLSNVFGLGK